MRPAYARVGAERVDTIGLERTDGGGVESGSGSGVSCHWDFALRMGKANGKESGSCACCVASNCCCLGRRREERRSDGQTVGRKGYPRSAAACCKLEAVWNVSSLVKSYGASSGRFGLSSVMGRGTAVGSRG